MTIAILALSLIAALTQVITADENACESKLTSPCSHFLERQTDYEECRNLEQLKKLDGLKL